MTGKELEEIVLNFRHRTDILFGEGSVNLGNYTVNLEHIGKNVHLSIESNDEEDDFYEEAESKYFDDAWQMLIGKLYIGTIYTDHGWM